jgi:hypothetical protein
MKTPMVSALACLAFAACGSGPTSSSDDTTCTSASAFPPSALSSVTSDSGNLSVAIHAAPYQPLVAGLDCVELVVTDRSTGVGVDGLTLAMTPWMPAMGHGASVTPQVTALGQGRYVFTDVSLFMPGEWQLRTKLSGPPIEAGDSVEPTFNVD